MFPRSKFSITLWATVCTSLLLATIVSGLALAQQTTAERVRGNATVSTSQVKGEVVQVEGNDLLVKLSTGDLKTFHVPETRKFHIDGRELSVHDLQPGTTLTATVKTTTTPVTVRTRSRLSGRVWFVAAPNVILTLPDGQNKQYIVKEEDNVRFTIEGRPATVFDLRKGMTVSAEKIVEAPDVEITADTSVVGHAPALQAAAPRPGVTPPAAPTTGALPLPTPAAPDTAAPAAPRPAAPETTTATPAQPAAPETTTPTAAQPTAPETGGTGTSPLLWLSVIAMIIIVIVIVARRKSAKQ
jgi:LPXTG-motif cell wall-anchored protein